MATLMLIPRTIVCIFLFWEGSKFLVHTDSYMDLILNSVALGFVIEIDDYLFAATASQTSKFLVSKLQGILVVYRNSQFKSHWVEFERFRRHKFPQTLFYTLMITGSASIFFL